MNKNFVIGLVVVIALALITLGLTSTGLFGLKDDTIRIGYIGPLTGDAGVYGQDMVKAMELIVSDSDNKIELITEDAQCDGKSAVNAVTKLIDVDNVDLIIGGTCSGETLAASPIAEANGVLLLSPSSTAPEVTNAGDFVFRIIPSDIYQANVAANIAKEKLNAKTVAIIYVKAAFPEGLKTEFTKTFESQGGKVIIAEGVEQNPKDLRTEIMKVLSKDPDAIYVIGYEAEYKLFFKQFKEAKGNVPVIAADTVNAPTILSDIKEFPVRVLFAFPKSNWKNSELVDKFDAKYNAEFTAYTPYAYDALNLLLDAIDKTNSTDPKVIKDYLYKMPTFKGITGNISFDKQGDLKGTEFEIFEIKEGKAVVIGTVN